MDTRSWVLTRKSDHICQFGIVVEKDPILDCHIADLELTFILFLSIIGKLY